MAAVGLYHAMLELGELTVSGKLGELGELDEQRVADRPGERSELGDLIKLSDFMSIGSSHTHSQGGDLINGHKGEDCLALFTLCVILHLGVNLHTMCNFTRSELFYTVCDFTLSV